MTVDTPVRVSYRRGASRVIHFSVPEYARSYARMMARKDVVELVQVGSERIERVS
jgi:hypothetical protein